MSDFVVCLIYYICMVDLGDEDVIFFGTHLSGISSIGNEFCAIVEDKNQVLVFTIDDKGFGTLVKELDKSQIMQIKADIHYSKNKSILGRSLFGGAIAGVGGAIIGALSAIVGNNDVYLSIIETTSGNIVFESIF